MAHFMGESTVRRLSTLFGAALAALVFSAQLSFATPAQVPVVLDTAGRPMAAGAQICVDLTGAYVGCGSGVTSLSPWAPDGGSLITAAPTGTSSLSTAFSGAGLTVYVKNIGNVSVHFRSVLTTGTALVTDERLLPGMCGPISRGTGDRLAMITDSGTGSVEITTGSGNPGFGQCYDVTTPSAVTPSTQSLVSGLTAAMTGTASVAVTGMGAPSAGIRNYITDLVCGNSHATVGTFVDLQDGNGGTVFWTVPAGAVYQGAAIHFYPPLKQPTTATALYAHDQTTGANVICSASGFTGS